MSGGSWRPILDAGWVGLGLGVAVTFVLGTSVDVIGGVALAMFLIFAGTAATLRLIGDLPAPDDRVSQTATAQERDTAAAR